ncbi:MAG TPA: HDIG domain-containing protein [Chloroflexota bacterium]|nr:HDIG domain-containing protein [Chloroflexota bacterium]
MDNEVRAVTRRRAATGRLPGPWRVVMFGLVLALALFATLTFQLLPSRYALSEGDVSPYNIMSPVKVTYVSQIRTAQARQQAAAAVPEIYASIPDAAADAQARASAALSQISQIRRSTVTDTEKQSQLINLSALTITPTDASTIVALDDVQWREVVTDTLRLIDRTMSGQIKPEQVNEAKATLGNQVEPGLDQRENQVIVDLARNFIGPTEQIDTAATAAARNEAASAVQPVRVTIEKGESILRTGDIVTASDLERLEAVGLRNPMIQWPEVLAMALIASSLSVLLCFYVWVFQPTVASNPRRLLLLGFLLVMETIAGKLTIPGRELYLYLFPLAAVPMLLAILLDTELSLVATVVLAVLMGMVANDGLEPVVATLVAGGLGAITVHRMERINVLTMAAAAVAVGNVAVIVAFQSMSGGLDLQMLLVFAGLAAVSGMLSAALTLGTMSFLGHIFGIATTMNLLELAHPSQPLFRRLLTEAPGTYHHSVVVANLAERAAAAIGADTLLVRIGGYYHDIGKLIRPYAFVENQMDGQNIHDQLDAYTSARIIVAHVQDGLTLAEKYGIPSRIRDLISQHHGSMLVQYFYRQASKGAEQPVDESLFRYPGPRPQSREAAIMMLADGVEAAVRANRDHSSESIAAIVDKIFQDRISSGQLDESDLTLNDLQRIRQSFMSVLQSIFHPRIEYPPEVINQPVAAASER